MYNVVIDMIHTINGMYTFVTLCKPQLNYKNIINDNNNTFISS